MERVVSSNNSPPVVWFPPNNSPVCTTKYRNSHRRCSVRKSVLRNFTKCTGKHLCQSLFFNKVAGLRPTTLLKKEILIQGFSCEFCKIFKSTFFTEHLRAIASKNICTFEFCWISSYFWSRIYWIEILVPLSLIYSAHFYCILISFSAICKKQPSGKCSWKKIFFFSSLFEISTEFLFIVE